MEERGGERRVWGGEGRGRRGEGKERMGERGGEERRGEGRVGKKKGVKVISCNRVMSILL